MIILLIVLFTTTFLAYRAKSIRAKSFSNDSGQAFLREEINYNGLLIFLIMLVFILFVGLRNSYNDTYNYIVQFRKLATGIDALKHMKFTLGNNPGFEASEILIKTYISKDPHMMLFIYALCSIVPIILFYKRWSVMLWLTIYLFIAAGMLIFSMAAVKQVFAMAIGIWGVTLLIYKRPVSFIILILIGSLFHSYLFMFLVAFFLQDKVWSNKTLLIIVGVVISIAFLEQFLEMAYSITEKMDMGYTQKSLKGTGINPLRFVVYSISPILSFVFRKEINNSKDKAMILFCNLTLIGWCFMLIGLYTNANVFGRMAMYFDLFMHITLTYLLVKCVPKTYRQMAIYACVIVYFFFFFYANVYARSFEYHWIFI